METTTIQFLWEEIRVSLENKKARILEEIRNYPRPVAGCDAQFNHLIAERDNIFRELSQVESASRLTVPNTETLRLVLQFLDSSVCMDAETEQHIRTQLNDTQTES